MRADHDGEGGSLALLSLITRLVRRSGPVGRAWHCHGPYRTVCLQFASYSVPTAQLHNIKHNKVLHERTLILAVRTLDVPYVDDASRVQMHDLGHGVFELEVSYGFAGTVDLPRALRASNCLQDFDAHNTSWFMGRQTVRAAKLPLMRPWRRRLFAWMLRSGSSASEYFRLPSNRVVELGSEVRL